MAFTKIMPRARSGITGVSVEQDLVATNLKTANETDTCWLNPPERVAALTIAVNKKSGYTGAISYTVECCCNTTAVIGEDGTGGYWHQIEKGISSYAEDKVLMITNLVTGARVRCTAGKVNVCFAG